MQGDSQILTIYYSGQSPYRTFRGGCARIPAMAFGKQHSSSHEQAPCQRDQGQKNALPQCLQLSSLLRRAARLQHAHSGSRVGQTAAESARLLSLQTELEQERRQHAATAVCLQQEQEMLAVLATRLAQAETAARLSTADLMHLQQDLQDEQHLCDIALRTLIELSNQNADLQQQLQLCDLSSVSAAVRGPGRGLVARAACIAAGTAAAAVLPARLPPAVVDLAGPAAAAALAAKATGAVISALGSLRRRTAPASPSEQPSAQQDFHPPVSTTAAAAAPASFNCWEQGDVLIQACCSSSSDDFSIATGSRVLLAAAQQLGVICAWDDSSSSDSDGDLSVGSSSSSCFSLDCHLDSEESGLLVVPWGGDAPHALPNDTPVPAKPEPAKPLAGSVLAWALPLNRQRKGGGSWLQEMSEGAAVKCEQSYVA